MLPMPTAPAQMTADGVLQQGAPQSRDQYWKAAKASGWTEGEALLAAWHSCCSTMRCGAMLRGQLARAGAVSRIC
jgi:hypothetical protein